MSGAVAAVRAALVGACCMLPTLCAAQGTARPARPARIEVAVLASAAPATHLDATAASLIGNAVPTGAPSTFFETESRLRGWLGGDVRLAVRVAGPWWVEAGVGYAQPTLEVRLDADVEQAISTTASSRLTQVVADGAIVRRWGRGRVSPFVAAGAGYLRQLDEPRTTVGTGQVYVGSAGVLVGLGGSRRALPRLRLRADLRVVSYHGGLPLVDARTAGVVGAVGLSVRIR